MRAFLVFVLAGCLMAAPLAEAQSPYSRIAKLSVGKAGEISWNRTRIPLDELELELQRLKEEGGAIWYYRVNPHMEPNDSQIEVIEVVAKSMIPVRLVENEAEML